jgi:DNA mismatch endonuclease (patch repair protein)
VAFWTEKFAANVARDRVRAEALRQAGWRVATVWECALRGDKAERTVGDLDRWLRSGEPEYESPVIREQAHEAITHRLVR